MALTSSTRRSLISIPRTDALATYPIAKQLPSASSTCIVLTRLRKDERTREYLARRQAEGKSKREVIRCLKRYVAREIYHVLQRLGPGAPAA